MPRMPNDEIRMTIIPSSFQFRRPFYRPQGAHGSPANRIPLPPASRIPYSPHSCFPLSIRQSFRYISLYENQGRIAWPSSRPITEDFMSTPWFQTLFAERIGGVNY